MATYGRRSSQRLRREEPDVTSSSRHPVSSSRREAEVSTGSQTQSSRSTRRLDDDDNPTYPIWGFMIRPNQLSMTDTARKQAEQVGQAEINKKAADLARYAMACEYSRTLIRKDDIRTKVLDNNTSRSFAPVFNAAQQLLFRTFGMYMVEVRAKGADNAELARQAQQVLRTATSSANGLRPRNQQRNDSAGPPDGQATNIWVVRSALPLSIITGLVCADEELSHAYALSSTSNTSSSTSQRRRQPAKELRLALDWKSADRQDGEMGLLYIILALILVNGRIITDATLHMYLRRIHLNPQTQLPGALRGTGPAFTSASSGSQGTQTQSRARAMHGTLEGFMNAMTKQAYLEKQRSDVGVDVMDAAISQAQTQGRRRGRASGGGGRAAGAADEDTMWEWRWGARAEAEVGEQRIAELISLIFTDPSATPEGAHDGAGEEEDEETQAIDRDRLAKRRKMLLTNIASVAGSQLVN